MADRYTYIPHIGLFIMAVWLLFSSTSKGLRCWAAAFLVAVMLVPLAMLTQAQVQSWKDDNTLYRHALSINQNNAVAHNNLGLNLEDEDEYEQALDHLKIALELDPSARRHFVLANFYRRRLRNQEALENYLKAVELAPKFAMAHHSLGAMYFQQSKLNKAAYHFKKTIEAEPLEAGHHNNLGAVYARLKKYNLAIEQFTETLRINPDDAVARENLALLKEEQEE